MELPRVLNTQLPFFHSYLRLRTSRSRKKRGKREIKTHLARNSPAIENRILGLRSVERRIGMHVNRVKTFMPFEELLPQWCQQDRTSRQEHESNFRYPFEWKLVDFRDHRRPPKQFCFAHRVRRLRRSCIILFGFTVSVIGIWVW